MAQPSAAVPSGKNTSPLVAPETIVFTDVDRAGVSTSTLILRNDHTSKSLYFKVRLTMPKSYRVRPNEGEIKPGESFPIPVTVTSKAPAVEQRMKDRFQIISIVADDKAQAAFMWKQYNEKKSLGKGSLPFAVYEQRLKCVFGGRPADTRAAVPTTAMAPAVATSTAARPPPGYEVVVSENFTHTAAAAAKMATQTHHKGALHAAPRTPPQAARDDDMLKLVLIFVLGLVLGKMVL